MAERLRMRARVGRPVPRAPARTASRIGHPGIRMARKGPGLPARKTRGAQTPPGLRFRPLGQIRKKNVLFRAFYDVQRQDAPVVITTKNVHTNKTTHHRLTHKEYVAFQKKLHAAGPAQFAVAFATDSAVWKGLFALAHQLG